VPTRRELLLLFAAALALYTANIQRLSLPSLDDCFYAREGVEMARRSAFFTVRWNGSLNFDYPSLQIWLLSRSFALFGVNDFAARLPSVAMGFGTLLMTCRIGVLALTPAAGAGAAALLLIAPYFANGARRCMIDVPLTFWITLAMLLLLEGRRRPRLHALLAIPLGAAILTKSVLGLLPLLVLAGAAVLDAAWRRRLARPWLWIGAGAGLALGSSWSLWEWHRFGSEVLRRHYFGQVGGFVGRRLGVWARLAGYPFMALRDFEPAFLPAVPGIIRAVRRSTKAPEDGRLLVLLWALIPFVLYGASGTQSPRYLFPIFPPLALLGAWWFEDVLPRFARVLRVYAAPALALIAALLFWVAPRTLSADANRAFRESQQEIRARVAPGESIAFLGARFWTYANPLMFYAERLLEPPAVTPAQALARARAHPARLLLCGAGRLADVRVIEPGVQVVVQSGDWALISVPPAATKPAPAPPGLR
jgi:4-amino-4-deoxy-L-arabinose transferase-like glycosyltransferase